MPVISNRFCRHLVHPCKTLPHHAGVIADTKHMKRRAWQKIAQEEGLRVPSDEQLDKVADMRLERAIMEVPTSLCPGICGDFEHTCRCTLL